MTSRASINKTLGMQSTRRRRTKKKSYMKNKSKRGSQQGKSFNAYINSKKRY